MKTQIDLLKQYKIPVRGHLGQHLLIDPNVQKKIVDLLDLKPNEWVFEIGPGLGALTGEIFKRGGCVSAVEKDRRFCGVLRENFAAEIEEGRFFLNEGDILKTEIRERMREKPHIKIRKVVSNLPYYITGPAMFKVFSAHDLLDMAVFMMQLEVAERVFAEPGSKIYGRLSISVRLYADAKHAFDVSRNCFTPPPEVRSAVVKFAFHHKLEKVLKDIPEALMLGVIQTAFSHRRKKMITILSGHEPYGLSRKEWEAVFEKYQIPPAARPEELMFKDFVTIAGELARTGDVV